MLQTKKLLKTPYKWQDVFDLQFPHYKKFIQAVNNRKEDEKRFFVVDLDKKAGTWLSVIPKNRTVKKRLPSMRYEIGSE